jgi:DNA-binding NarL/FixJ family response regulator
VADNHGESPWIDQLTTLHFRVLAHVVAGASYQHIADTVFVSKRTVCRLVAELKEAAGVDNMVGLGVEAVRRGWVSNNGQAERWRLASTDVERHHRV